MTDLVEEVGEPVTTDTAPITAAANLLQVLATVLQEGNSLIFTSSRKSCLI